MARPIVRRLKKIRRGRRARAKVVVQRVRKAAGFRRR